MAERPAFHIRQGKVIGEMYSFKWFPGFAVSQKQKSIESLHDAIRKTDADTKPLEISAISGYNYFTDIEFNPSKSLNTQARTAAMIKLILEEHRTLPDFSRDEFIQYHKEHIVYETIGGRPL